MENGSSYLRDVDELLSSLPACRRCRQHKRRCDTQLPMCQNCSKAGVECIFFDHVLQKDLPRSYVSALLQRLRRTQHERNRPRTSRSSQSSQSPPEYPACPQSMRRNQIPQTSRYLGSHSCLMQALPAVYVTNIQEETIPVPLPPAIRTGEELNCVVNQEIHNYLIRTYLMHIHPLYPFLDDSLPFFSPPWRIDTDSTALNPQQHFILQLIYSIATHHILDHVSTDQQRHFYQTLADECHRRAWAVFDVAATDSSIPTLQTVTLAALHSLFSPQQGNSGQLIGLAARLAIDLCPYDKPHITRGRPLKLQQIYTSVYCIENQVATAMDRPTLLPAPPHIEQVDLQNPQDILCALHRMQSRFRYCSDQQEMIGALSQELSEYINHLEQSSIKASPSLLAVAYETRLLLYPKCDQSAARLLEVYLQQHYIRTFLSPHWAYRAGMTITSENSRQGQQSQDGTNQERFYTPFQAYGNCLVFLEQCSRRWPSVCALKRSLQSAASKS